MNHVTIFFEHINFFNCLDGLDIEFFQRSLEFFVICARGFMDLFDFSPGGSFAAFEICMLAHGEFWGIGFLFNRSDKEIPQTKQSYERMSWKGDVESRKIYGYPRHEGEN